MAQPALSHEDGRRNVCSAVGIWALLQCAAHLNVRALLRQRERSGEARLNGCARFHWAAKLREHAAGGLPSTHKHAHAKRQGLTSVPLQAAHRCTMPAESLGSSLVSHVGPFALASFAEFVSKEGNSVLPASAGRAASKRRLAAAKAGNTATRCIMMLRANDVATVVLGAMV